MDVTFLILSPIITFTTSFVVFRMVLRASEETKFLLFNPPNTFEPISLWRDLAWIAVLALLSGSTNTLIWPYILRETPGNLRRWATVTLSTAVLDIPFIFIDRHYLSEGLFTRLKGGLLPLTTIWAILRITIIPLGTMLALRIATWMRKPKKMKKASISKILQPCQAPQDEFCGICQDEFENAVALTCHHVFCRDCIQLALQARSVCPICMKQYG